MRELPVEEIMALWARPDDDADARAALEALVAGAEGERREAAVWALLARHDEAFDPAAALRRDFWRGALPGPPVVDLAVDGALGRSSGAAFEALAPMLAPSEREDHFGRMRADTILRRLEEAVVALSLDPELQARKESDEGGARRRASVEIDPRWREPCAAFVATEGESSAAYFAGEVARGLAWLAGDFVREPAPIVELADAAGPEPCARAMLVAGVVLGAGVDVVRSAAFPKGIYRFQHQYGGLACLQALLVGFAVQLPPELARALAPLAGALAGGAGEPLTKPELAEWTARAREVAPAFPALSWGAEAMVVSSPMSDASRALRGRPVLAFRARVAPWRTHSFATEPVPEILETVPYGEAHDAALVRVAHAYSSLPCLAILWESSD
jgi:hypothetical protein